MHQNSHCKNAALYFLFNSQPSDSILNFWIFLEKYLSFWRFCEKKLFFVFAYPLCIDTGFTSQPSLDCVGLMENIREEVT